MRNETSLGTFLQLTVVIAYNLDLVRFCREGLQIPFR